MHRMAPSRGRVRLRRSMPGFRPLSSLVLAATVWLSAAYAEDVSFSVEMEGVARSATSATSPRNGVAYVSIGSIARQLGMGVTIGSDQLQVDFQNRSALIRYSSREVNASSSKFTISRPVILSGSEVWMAVDDVEPFLRGAFRLSAQRREARASTRDDLEALEPLDTEASGPPGAASTLPAAEDTPLDPLTEDDLGKVAPSAPTAPSPPASAGPVVIVDPGHGGGDTGIAGRALAEKDLALAVATRLKAHLEETPGLTVRLTREDDRELSVLDRINLAIANRGRLFVSIHAGSSLSLSANGTEVFYPTDSGLTDIGLAGTDSILNAADRRANALQSRSAAQALTNALANESPAGQRGARSIRSRLLHNVPMPALLIEVGFITNPTEEAVLATPEYQEVLAEGIAAGIRQYLGLSPVGAAPPSSADSP